MGLSRELFSSPWTVLEIPKEFPRIFRALNLGTGKIVVVTNNRPTILPLPWQVALPPGEGRGEGESFGQERSLGSSKWSNQKSNP